MKRISILLFSSLVAMGCQQDGGNQGKELEALKAGQEKLQADQAKLQADQGKLLEGQAKILAAIKTAPSRAAAARPQRPARPRPNPASVYSVNISDAPFKGAKNAKVTIVEAFEFA